MCQAFADQQRLDEVVEELPAVPRQVVQCGVNLAEHEQHVGVARELQQARRVVSYPQPVLPQHLSIGVAFENKLSGVPEDFLPVGQLVAAEPSQFAVVKGERPREPFEQGLAA